ncbi:hypothetical protein HM1_0409 [Heliomicrobium modesticaldum Ice1]|uniref:CBS domain-containing protein n=1 Tax=Heliobacterium modesticaldum (strain ATCC 51547 / Ice1) TaxID=498761 RepID=B0TF43_HELMI|nr:DUF294 nucleotidyltransferase-like domain-containing protein [Heliomicrobium modesticaldum]ABZ83026.1 hypothetical protein HM1_0409 [Heliomicrobium modesticaldum Ice1]
MMDPLAQIRAIAPFDQLPEEALRSVAEKMTSLRFSKGEVIFSQNQPAFPHLFLALDGMAEIIIQNDAGVSTVIGFRQGGEFFGETCIVEKKYPATVKAIDDMTCLTIPFDELHRLWEKHAAFSAYFSRLFASRFRAMIDEIVAEHSGEAPGMDGRPFRKRAVDMMSSPVYTIAASEPVTKAARLMADKRVGSLVVTEGEHPIGIITERDLVYNVLAAPFPDDATGPLAFPPLKSAMNSRFITLPPESYYYQVLLTMIRETVRYVGVVDKGRLLGIVALTDLIRNRDAGALSIVDGIEHCRSVDELAARAKVIDRLLTAMVAEQAQPAEITEVITVLYDRLTVRIIELALDVLAKRRLTPPAPFCWLTMGSGGRREQTLRTDQDHAIVFADVPEEDRESARAFYLDLGELVTKGLEACGFARCPGQVMAGNPRWCHSFSEWMHRLGVWVEESVPDHVRQLTIFLDFRGLYGDQTLARRLRDAVCQTYRRFPVGLHHLAKDDLRHQVSLGFFKPFVTEKSGDHKDEIDLKRSLLVHLIDCVRVFALREGIPETNTLTRIHRLAERGVFHANDAEQFCFSYNTLTGMRFRENLRKLQEGRSPDNYIHPYRLTKREQAALKEAIQGVIRLQSLTGSAFRVEGFL